jgi:hypothetical protein
MAKFFGNFGGISTGGGKQYGSARSFGGSVGRSSMINQEKDPFLGYNISDLGGGRVQIGKGDQLSTIVFGEESAVDYEGSEGLINLIKNSQGKSRTLQNIFNKYRTADVSSEEKSRRAYFKEQRASQMKDTPGDRFANALGSSLLSKTSGLL